MAGREVAPDCRGPFRAGNKSNHEGKNAEVGMLGETVSSSEMVGQAWDVVHQQSRKPCSGNRVPLCAVAVGLLGATQISKFLEL